MHTDCYKVTKSFISSHSERIVKVQRKFFRLIIKAKVKNSEEGHAKL